ncbi:MAG TPA: tRNA (adenosine(37)-N6)-threonylcarbamoyltransferase complex dimerization subunit type 1 TsaB [Chloroflexota bacterium]|nr:tRNA (adenosine(37)-N6)-threonylcarbamoyltransferase complex dimerization subunit type 1 TsaB [Chloroflexota bacterium]
MQLNARPEGHSRPPVVLAIDTSTHQASVAVCAGDEVLSTRTWLAGRQHTSTLLPAVRDVMAEASASPRDLSALAVALGPGSFNGLRTGLSTAKGLALVWQLPLLGIPTLELLAEEYHLPVATMHAAPGRVYVWHRGSPASAITIEDGSAPDRIRHAETLARLAVERLSCSDPAAGQLLLEPLYVQPPNIHHNAPKAALASS